MAQTIYKKNLSYKATRYEEWQAGKCISRGDIELEVNGTMNGEQITFSIKGEHQLRIPNEFDFNISESCILRDGRVQYVKAPGNIMNPVIPVVCHLFIKESEIQCVRFAMTNPDRLIEFYGTHINKGHDNDEKKYKLSFLSALVNLASNDGEIEESELEMIYAYMNREGLCQEDLERVLFESDKVEYIVPDNPLLKIQYLQDLVTMAMVDGVFKESEYYLCKIIAHSIGFDPCVIDAMRKDINKKVGSNI